MYKHQRSSLIYFGILLHCLKIVNSQNTPHIPCPNIFKYMSYGDNYIGSVTLSDLPLATTVVEVEFAQRESITTSYVGRLSLNQDLRTTQSNLERGQPISYRVDFPISHVLPKLTGIKVNGNTICIGQGLGAPSTTFKLQHTFYPAVSTPLSITTRHKTDNSNNNNNNGGFVYPLLPSTTTVFTQRPPTLQQNVGSDLFSNSNPFLEKFFNQGQISTRVFEIPLTPPVSRPPVNIPVNKPVVRPPVTIPVTKPVDRPPVNTPVNTTPKQSTEIECGRQGLTPFVVRGTDFPRGTFPWLAAIYIRDSADLKFTCGASLISTTTVITAAHCFPTPTFSPDLISVNLGRHNLFVSEIGSQQRDIRKLTIHPNYNVSVISDADIALLHFTEPVQFSQYIRPICLWTQSVDLQFVENQKGFIAGWGADNNGHSVTSQAQMVEAKIVSESECLHSSDLFRTLTSSRSLCAGNRDGSGPCIGDSGGGLMLNVFGSWTLRGILSVGKTIQRKCDLNEYVVYCDVAKHMTWVRQNM